MMMDCFSMMAGFEAGWGIGGTGTMMAIVALLASGVTYLVMRQSAVERGEQRNG